MGIKICPICDAKVNSINFCPECKRFVAPKEMKQNFYLNESRRNDEYVGTDYEQKQYNADKSVVMKKRTTINKSGKTKRIKDSIKSIIIILAWFAIVVAIYIGRGYKIDFGNDDYDYDVEQNDEITEAVLPDDNINDYGNYVNEADENALSEEEVKSDGKACTIYGHYSGIGAVEFMDKLSSCAEENEITLNYNKNYGYKKLYNYGTGNEKMTCYDLCDVFSTSGFAREAVATYYDYNTGEIHCIYIYATANENKDGSVIIPLFDTVVDALGDNNLIGSEQENIHDYLNEYIEKSAYTLENDDSVMISVGDWCMYIGRNSSCIYVEMYASNSY
ncbi:MAG: hypothetical protein ACI4EF_08200 [Coprococcus sp.]